MISERINLKKFINNYDIKIFSLVWIHKSLKDNRTNIMHTKFIYQLYI